MNKRNKGMTLIELIIILFIATLVTIAIPRISESRHQARVNTCELNIKIANKAIELYKIDNGHWPKDLEDVTHSSVYFPDGPPKCGVTINKGIEYPKTLLRNADFPNAYCEVDYTDHEH